MTSIIIPAHNEENNIANCVTPLLPLFNQLGNEIVVVCNGCTDKTADRVRQLDKRITCLETDVPSKSNALNMGDQHANSFPRIFIDADIVINPATVDALCDKLSQGYLAASTRGSTNTEGCEWGVKAFYDIWQRTPYFKEGFMGSGLYAISEEGRKRFDVFPDIFADDSFIRCTYNSLERGVTENHFSVVKAPKTFLGLIRVKTRSRLGRYQLRDKLPELSAQETNDYQGAIKKLLPQIHLWPKLFTYVAINLITRLRANYFYSTNKHVWERDESTR
ncbi:MAG: glycosyltransferase [Methylococcaceae bacterium]